MPVPEIIELGGDADIFQARAGVNASGGMFVIPASGTWSGPVTSTGTVAVYTSNIVTVTSTVASGTDKPIGLVLQDTASGTSSYVPLIRKGTVILRTNLLTQAGSDVTASAAAAASSGRIAPALVYNAIIGNAYTSAGSNEYAVVRLNL